MRRFPNLRSANSQWVLVLTIAGLFTGCGQDQELPTRYGRAYGPEYTTSVNGTLVLHEMLRDQGHDIHRYSKMSPRWDRYKTVYWIPDDYHVPESEIIDEVESWLVQERNRTCVYVARDFDAAALYWEAIRKKRNTLTQDDSVDRELANAWTEYATNRTIGERQSCRWFEIEPFPFQTATTVSGPLATGIDAAELDVRYGWLPLPNRPSTGSQTNDNYDVEILLSVDSNPFVYSLTKSTWNGSQVIIVGNGSFLLNLPLTQAENREIALRLIHRVDQVAWDEDPVLFIENTGPLKAVNSDNPNEHTKWSWITKEPLRYIVPNILFWCLLFCFVYFPIFGRARKIKERSTNNFQDHVDSLARLLWATKSQEEPKSWIDEYRRRTLKTRSRTADPKEPNTSP